MSDACPRFGKWIGGCRFEPRYDERRVGSLLEDAFGSMGMFSNVTVTEEVKVDGKTVKRGRFPVPESTKTYLRDVCVRCGRSIEREKA